MSNELQSIELSVACCLNTISLCVGNANLILCKLSDLRLAEQSDDCTIVNDEDAMSITGGAASPY